MDLAMDFVHENSVVAISALQSRFRMQSEFMFLISNLFDPRYAFLFYAPLIFSLDRYTGRKLMWVAVIAEWSNQCLKWMLMGERPYWWVHETGVYNRTGAAMQPPVKQYFMTCETGPGSPSGHAMVTAAVFYILFESFIRQSRSQTKSSMVNRIVWSVYTVILCTVSLSRVYLAAHFPHQCLMGSIIGVAVAMLVSSADTDRFQHKHYIMGSAGMFISAMTVYAVIKGMGMDPMWTLNRAIKWCDKAEHVHIDTTPFFSMMRYCGFFLGMGFGLFSRSYAAASKIQFTTGMKILSAILACGAAKASEFIVLPKSNIQVLYAFAFVVSAILPYLYIAVVPYIVTKVWPSKGQKRKAN